jgi:galactosylceramidase
MKRNIIILFFFFALFCHSYAQKVITINPDMPGRIYEGTGALSAGASSRLLIDYPEPQRSQILDYLFKPQYGASLNHLKVEIGGDVNSTCGTESSHQHVRGDESFERGYEWWLMKEAKKRNPDIKLDVLAWGAPAWIGGGHYYSEDMLDYVSRFLIGAKKIQGLDIDYVGIWNERPYNVKYIKSLRRQLDRYKIKTRIVAADEIRSYYICRDMLKDPELFKAIDVVGTHYAHGQGAQLYNGKSVYEEYGQQYKIIWKEALDTNKPIWSLEDGPWAEDWNGARGIIKVLTRNYIDAKMVKTIFWSLLTAYHDNIAISASGLMKANTPWSGHYILKPALWAVAHLTQFATPGWIYLEGGANGYLENGGSYVSLISKDKHDMSIVLESVDSKTDEDIDFKLLGDYAEKSFHVWHSDSLHQFVCESEVLTPSDGVLKFHVSKGSMYTLTTLEGQRKGDTSIVIPAASSFSLPYKDDFEHYKAGRLPKFTSDIAGVFEVADFDNHKVLKQVTPTRGIEWAASLNAEPFTVIGDYSLTDYTIKMDVRLEKKGQHAYVMGRIPSIVQGQVLPPMGYWLRLSTLGRYELYSTLPAENNGAAPFRESWKESNDFFKETANSKIISSQELKKWPQERIDMFEGLCEAMNQVKGVNDIVLVLYSNNAYQIYPLKKLAYGRLPFPVGKWNKVSLQFKGSRISSAVNGKKLFDVTDDKYTAGMAGFGTGWHEGMFDNLEILP